MQHLTDCLFNKIADDPYKYAEEYKRSGKQVIGYFCSYTPEEIITAAGSLPFRIFGFDSNISLANAHLQSYSCNFIRSALEDALSGRLNFLSGAIFPHTCDSIQRLSDIWRLNAGFDSHFDIVLPAKLNIQSSKDYMIDVLKRFKKNIEQRLNVEITNERLKASIAIHNQIREYLNKLYKIKISKPNIISGSDIHSVFKASMVMDRNAFLQKLIILVNKLEQTNIYHSKTDMKRIVLSGSLCNMPNIYETIENAGGFVAADDTCTGFRYWEGKIDENGDPIKAIADKYYNRTVCPSKHSNLFDRGKHIVDLVKKNNAAGVIFLFLKFCDPHSFDYPYIKDCLDKENIKSILFQVEEKMSYDGQFQTRCEAFIEML